MHRKPHLPQKHCLCCGRLFAWRKKWAKVWDEVKFCSERCRLIDLGDWLDESFRIPGPPDTSDHEP